jgi:hypothetical protein
MNGITRQLPGNGLLRRSCPLLSGRCLMFELGVTAPDLRVRRRKALIDPLAARYRSNQKLYAPPLLPLSSRQMRFQIFPSFHSSSLCASSQSHSIPSSRISSSGIKFLSCFMLFLMTSTQSISVLFWELLHLLFPSSHFHDPLIEISSSPSPQGPV